MDKTQYLTFLGIDIYLLDNGDLNLTQERFTRNILKAHGRDTMSSNKTVTMLPPPDVPDVPSVKELRLLQKYSGEFNWLATRTRPDISYYTSLLASSCSKYNKWSLDLAKKIHRYLIGTADTGIVISTSGSESDLKVYTDAGFSGISKTHTRRELSLCLETVL